MTPVGRSEQIQAILDSRATAMPGGGRQSSPSSAPKKTKVTVGTRIVDTLLMRMDVFEAHAALRCPGTTVDHDENHATLEQVVSRTKNTTKELQTPLAPYRRRPLEPRHQRSLAPHLRRAVDGLSRCAVVARQDGLSSRAVNGLSRRAGVARRDDLSRLL